MKFSDTSSDLAHAGWELTGAIYESSVNAELKCGLK